jgi:hypothetical protein
MFGISNFGHWDLFDIWDLGFGIYSTPSFSGFETQNPLVSGSKYAHSYLTARWMTAIPLVRLR